MLLILITLRLISLLLIVIALILFNYESFTEFIEPFKKEELDPYEILMIIGGVSLVLSIVLSAVSAML